MTDPLRLLWAMLGSKDGWHAIRLRQHGQPFTFWMPVGNRVCFEVFLTDWAWSSDAEISAVPYLDRGSYRFQGDSAVLWARTESKDACARLSRFKPEPTLVLREGQTTRRTALWALSRPLSPEFTERANERLSYHLHCPRKYAAPSFFLRPPGVVRTGRKRPVAVNVEHMDETALYSAAQVVKALKDAPLTWAQRMDAEREARRARA